MAAARNRYAALGLNSESTYILDGEWSRAENSVYKETKFGIRVKSPKFDLHGPINTRILKQFWHFKFYSHMYRIEG
jgi:hypothetical protein